LTANRLVDRLCELSGEAARQLRASDQLITKLVAENERLRTERDQAQQQLAELRRRAA
jgi:hypothetical protein